MPTQIIDWESGELVLIPRTTRKASREMKFWVICSLCGYRRQLTKRDANRASKTGACQICHCRSNGVKTMSKHGAKIAKVLRAKRLAYPSGLESLVMQALDALGLEYERELAFPLCNGMDAYIDFKVLGNSDFFLEANGLYYHGQSRAGRDTAIIKSCNILGIPLLIVHDFDLCSGKANELGAIQDMIAHFNESLPEKLPF